MASSAAAGEPSEPPPPPTVDALADEAAIAPDVLDADDSQALENDSAFGDGADDQSDRTSLSSGITRYRQENGRRYHAYKDGAYLLPNDEKEQDRLDLHHHVFNLVYAGTLHRAPVDNPNRVLDVGTGTGIWAIDFADQYPASHVIGTDFSPIQPGWVPPNLEFVIDDAEAEWTGHKYDYVHIRMLAGSIMDWDRLLAQAFAHLNPGGWIELTEFEVWMYSYNDSLELDGPNIMKWQASLSDASQMIGKSFAVAVHLREWVEKAGFENIREDVRKVPCGPWPRDRRLKEIGLYQQQNMLDAASSYGQAHFTRVLGWSADEYAVFSATVRNELRNSKLHLYSNLYKVIGQKPL